MPVPFKHDQQDHTIYFVTLTCFKWKWLFELSDAWHSVYKWFDALYKKDKRVTGYVIMPNHIHVFYAVDFQLKEFFSYKPPYQQPYLKILRLNLSY